MSWGPLSIELYVNNLTNQDALTYVLAPGSGGASNTRGFRLRPRTIGTQFTWSF